MFPRPTHGNGWIAYHLLIARAKSKGILVKLNGQVGNGNIAGDVAHIEDKLSGTILLAESRPEFNPARFFRGADLGHACLGLRGGGSRGGVKEVIHSSSSSGGRGSIVVDRKATHVKEVPTSLIHIILVLILLLVSLLNLVTHIAQAQSAISHWTTLGTHYKRLRRLVIDARKRGNLPNKNIQQIGFQSEGVILNDRLVTQYNKLGSLRICGEQPPINESTITQIGIVTLLCGQIQYPLDHILRLLGIFKEALDRGSEKLELHGGIFLLECFEEGIKEFVGVINAFSVFTNDPNHGGLGLGFVEGVKVVAEGGNDGLVSVGITTEDVLDDNDTLLDDIVDLGLDKFQEDADATLGRALELHGASSNGRHGLAHKVNIDLSGILLQFQQYLIDIAFRDQLDDDLQLLHFYIDGIVILAKEDLNLVLQNGRTLLHDQVNVAQCHVLDLRFGVEQRHEWRGQLPRQCSQTLSVGGIPPHHAHV
mmetsp:Transcript_26828/g.56647  ORF Transcript_26828/g.56647 Transcript_26828/m.56647 type:complete len:480 (+) Transcript_26828:733-2172(+)